MKQKIIIYKGKSGLITIVVHDLLKGINIKLVMTAEEVLDLSSDLKKAIQ